jgi:hypothetical protein
MNEERNAGDSAKKRDRKLKRRKSPSGFPAARNAIYVPSQAAYASLPLRAVLTGNAET